MFDSGQRPGPRPASARPRRAFLVSLALLLGLATAATADAQISRRNFINPSFEQPDLDSTCGASGNTWRPVDADIVDGWETTHSLWSPGNACGGPTPYRAIEFWESGFLGVPSLDGEQHVELNANELSRIYQFACLLANETMSYSYYHRARSGGTETSRAVLFDEAGSTLIDQGPDDAIVRAQGWVQHSGTLTNDGTTGPRQLGFIAIDSGSIGNFLDLVEVQLAPLVELVPAVNVPAAEDAGDTQVLQFLVNGILSNTATFTLVLDGGATASPTDFNITPGPLAGRGNIDSYSASDGTITITLPAGTYDPNETDNSGGEQGLFDIPITYTVDTQIEPDETIIYTPGAILVGGGASAALDLAFNDSNCDGNQTTQASFVITNDDVDIQVTIQLDTPGPYSIGQEVQFTLIVSNPNPGAATATNISFSNTPENLTITSVASPSCSGVPCVIPSLAPGASETIIVTATLDDFGRFRTAATASAEQGESNPANNSDNGADRSDTGYVKTPPIPTLPHWAMLLLALGLALAARRAQA